MNQNISIFCLLLAVIGTKASAACFEENLVTVDKEIFKIKEVGDYIGCYHYAVSATEKKFKFHANAARKFEIALALGLEMFVNTVGDDYKSIAH